MAGRAFAAISGASLVVVVVALSATRERLRTSWLEHRLSSADPRARAAAREALIRLGADRDEARRARIVTDLIRDELEAGPAVAFVGSEVLPSIAMVEVGTIIRSTGPSPWGGDCFVLESAHHGVELTADAKLLIGDESRCFEDYRPSSGERRFLYVYAARATLGRLRVAIPLEGEEGERLLAHVVSELAPRGELVDPRPRR
jgi:hypothetical protein